MNVLIQMVSEVIENSVFKIIFLRRYRLSFSNIYFQSGIQQYANVPTEHYKKRIRLSMELLVCAMGPPSFHFIFALV